MQQMKEEPKVNQKFRKQTELLNERLKDKFIPTKKFEHTGECERWIRCTQVEVDDAWKESREENIGEVLGKYGVETSKRGVQRQR